jgi:RNA 2',3'-cyclic 3'-phosphodiesterase
VRLFVAVTPPAEALADLQAGLATARALDTLGTLRWSRPDAWHLTLAFLGEVPDEALPGLGTRLARAGRRHADHEVAFHGGGRFGDRVLWVGLAGARLELRRLAESVQAAVRRSGIDIDERPFRPHLTVARSASRTDLKPFVEALRDYAGPAWPVTSYELIRSQLGQGPGRSSLYTVINSWALAEPGSGG